VLVLLVGPDARRNQAALQRVDKEYRVEICFGFATDSYDRLGLVASAAAYDPAALRPRLETAVAHLVGQRRQPIPPYSSKVVRGKPLFWWARHGRLDEVGLPQQQIKVQAAELVFVEEIANAALAARVRDGLDAVEGDFRQEQIAAGWGVALAQHPNPVFTVAQLRLVVSAGAYVRSLAHGLGAVLGIPAFVLRLTRTRCGAVGLSDCRPIAALLAERTCI
jgi:tRNA pseudouridine(55) synthase